MDSCAFVSKLRHFRGKQVKLESSESYASLGAQGYHSCENQVFTFDQRPLPFTSELSGALPGWFLSWPPPSA